MLAMLDMEGQYIVLSFSRTYLETKAILFASVSPSVTGAAHMLVHTKRIRFFHLLHHEAAIIARL